MCSTDANGDMQPTYDVDGMVHSFWIIYFPFTLLARGVFVLCWESCMALLSEYVKPLLVLCACHCMHPTPLRIVGRFN